MTIVPKNIDAHSEVSPKASANSGSDHRHHRRNMRLNSIGSKRSITEVFDDALRHTTGDKSLSIPQSMVDHMLKATPGSRCTR
jgi:hypothetical protein